MTRRRVSWARIYTDLPRGVVMRHRTMVAGWQVTADLVITSVGAMQVRVNGTDVEAPMMDCTMANGRRRYRAVLKRLERPQQMTLPV